MSDAMSHCTSCGGSLPSAPRPEGAVLRCPHCGAVMRIPEGRQPIARQAALPESAELAQGIPAERRHDWAGPPSSPPGRPTARGGRWRKTALATFAGVVVGALLWILALSPGWWSDFVDRWGMRYLLTLFPICGALLGFLLGSGLGWRATGLSTPWSVLGGLAGAVVFSCCQFLIGFLPDWPVLDTLRGPAFAFFLCVTGFLVGLLVGAVRRARKLQALYSTRALTLAIVAVAPPVVAIASLGCAFLLAGLLPVPRGGGYQPPMEQIVDPATGRVTYKPHGNPSARVAWCVALCGAGTALWALFCAYRAAVKHQEQSGLAQSRRRRAVGLALLALLLNGAPLPWLFRAGWPSPIVPDQKDLPSATERRRAFSTATGAPVSGGCG
jgi:hypothetical protein